MSASDYEAETAEDMFDLAVNANAYFSFSLSQKEQDINIWNSAIECAMGLLPDQVDILKELKLKA